MNPTMTQPQTDPRTLGWGRACAAWLLLLLTIMLLYRDTGLAMVGIWARSGTFTNAFLVPPIVLWLVWRQRQALSTLSPRPCVWLLLPMLGAAAAWLLGDLVAVNAVTQFALVAMIVLSVPAMFGLAVARQIAFPLCYLFFAVPFGEFLMPQLMEWTANFTVLALRLSGVPVYREGLQFVIPSGNWSVVEACSGVRYLIASLTVGTIFAYLNYTTTRRRVAFVIVSILVPLVANWLRAYMIVMLGHLSGNTIAVGVDHLLYGWVFFGVVMLLMFLMGARWAEPEPTHLTSAHGEDRYATATEVASVWAVLASLLLSVASPHVLLWATQRDGPSDRVMLSAPAALASDWKQLASSVPAFSPAYQSPAAVINTSYARDGRSVGLYVGYYRQQNYEHKLISSNNTVVTSNDKHWARVSNARRPVTLGADSLSLVTTELRSLQLPITAASSASDNARMLVWQVYWINGRATTSDYLAKVYAALDRLIGRGDDSAVMMLYTAQDPAGGADALLASFVADNYTVIDALLLNARSGSK